MKTHSLRNGYALLASLTVMTAVLSGTAVAQAPGDPGGPPPGQNGGPGNGGRTRVAGQPPFAFGTVSTVDANAGTITITSQFGGNGGSMSQVIRIDPGAQFVTQSEVAVADLKVGDQVQVQGAPTGITVSQFTVGALPAGLPGAGGFGPGGLGGPRGGVSGGGGSAGGSANGASPTLSFATAGGTIKTLPTKADPHLALSLSADAQLFVKIADGARITRYTTLKLTDLKSGDRITASGQASADGTLAASLVGVNLTAENGFGGPGGGPGR